MLVSIGRYLWSIGGQTQLTSLLIVFTSLWYKSNRFIVTACLLSNGSQKMSNGVRMLTFFCSYHILTSSVIYYCTTTWNLFVNYLMNSILCAFWLVLSCDLLMNRRIDDDSSIQVWQLHDFSEPIRMPWFVRQPMNLLHFVQTTNFMKWLFSRICQNWERIRSTHFWLKH